MLICQSKANLDVKIVFGKVIHLLDPEIRKVLEKGFYGIGKNGIIHLLNPEIRKMLEKGFYGIANSEIGFWSLVYLALGSDL